MAVRITNVTGVVCWACCVTDWSRSSLAIIAVAILLRVHTAGGHVALRSLQARSV